MTSKPNETDSQTNIDIEVVNRIYVKTESMLDWPLYTPSPNRECLYRVASPGKPLKKTNFPLKRVLGVNRVLGAPRARQKGPKIEAILARARARRPGPHSPWGPLSREILLKTESMLDWPLYTPSPNRECLYKVASPGKTPEKTKSMLDWPLYTPPPPTENASIKWPVQVKPLKKQNLCWTGHFIPFYTPSPNRECLYKVASPGKTPEKTESMLDWPLYTPSPNRECLYKVVSSDKTPEKTESMLDWPLYTILYPLPQQRIPL